MKQTTMVMAIPKIGVCMRLLLLINLRMSRGCKLWACCCFEWGVHWLYSLIRLPLRQQITDC